MRSYAPYAIARNGRYLQKTKIKMLDKINFIILRQIKVSRTKKTNYATIIIPNLCTPSF